MMRFPIVFVFMAVSLPMLARAADSLGTFGSWEGAVDTSEGAKVCYVTAVPEKSEGNYTQRDATYIAVTHRPASKSRDTISITAGYEYKPDSEVTVTIGQKSFSLFVQKDMAWTSSTDDDKKIVAAMKGGSKMVVVGYSKRGTKTMDTYSLAGFGKAYQAIGTECGVK